MAFVFKVNGSTKTLQPGWKITETANGPNQFSGFVQSPDGTFRIAVDDVITLTEGGTTIYAGLVDDPHEQGFGRATSPYGLGGTSGSAAHTQAFTALDYNSYAARIAVLTDTARPSESLKARLTWIVGLLSAQSVTLSGSQATGPTLQAATYTAGQYLIDVLNATMALADGTGTQSWVWDIDYTLVLSAIQAGSVSAPVNISEGDTNTIGDITVEQARPSTYANYVIVIGGQGTQAVTDNFTGDGSTVTFALNYPLGTSYGGVTVGGVFETLGTGATWTYSASTNSITRTSAPGLGVAISINYIAQFPVKVVADGGVTASKRVTKIYTAPAVFDIVVLQALANAYVTRDMDSPRTVKFNAAWSLTGWHPGQVLTINSTKRNLSTVTCLITQVDIADVAGALAQRQITAVTSQLLPATLRQQFQQTFGTSGGASAAGGVTIITSTGIGGSGTTGDIATFVSSTTLGSTHLITAGHGGTGVDTSALSGVPTINAGTWSVNNVLTANRLLIAAASNTVTSSAGLTYSGTTLTVNSTITTPAATDLTLSPTGNLITDPVGNSVLPATNFDIAIGAPAKRYLAIYAAELQVETLVAQSVIATIGGRILVCPTNLLSVDAASGDTTLHFKYNNLVNGDRIYFEGPDSAGTNSIEFMAVTSGAGGSAGNYTYTVTRNLDGTGANNWPAGSACADTGTTGSGFIDMYSVAGVKSGNGPTIVGNIRNSSTYNDISPRWAIGNLDGLYGYSGTTIGVALGDPAKAWIKLDDTNGVRIGYNTTVNAQIDISGNATFAAGSVTMDANGIRVAVISTQSTLHAYAFTTAFAGTNSVGTFGYEPTSTQRIVTVTNSTGAASKLVQTILSASGASTQATLNIVNDETGTPTPYIETNCVIRPSVNNTAPLGTASLRWSDVQTQLLTANGAATCNSTLNVGGTLAIGSTFFASGLGSSTGTTIVIDGGNFIRVNSSSERFKARIRRWAPTTSLLDVDPIQFDYVGGATDVVGFSAEALWDAGLTHLVNLDADGQPFSLREHALIAHLASIVKHQDARIAALEQR